MWAVNGAASALGSFVAVLVSMSASITMCVLTGGVLYLLGAVLLPRIVQQLREAGPYADAQRFLLFDRDSKFGN